MGKASTHGQPHRQARPLRLKTAFTFGAPQGGRVLSEDSTSLMVILIGSQLLATVIATQCPGCTLHSAG